MKKPTNVRTVYLGLLTYAGKEVGWKPYARQRVVLPKKGEYTNKSEIRFPQLARSSQDVASMFAFFRHPRGGKPLLANYLTTGLAGIEGITAIFSAGSLVCDPVTTLLLRCRLQYRRPSPLQVNRAWRSS